MSLDRQDIERTLTVGTDAQRLATLRAMREEVSDGEPAWCFDLARPLVSSNNNDVRWQSLIVLGEYLSSGHRHAEVWEVITQCWDGDDDMKDALATVLLEHLLEYDFAGTFRRIEDALPQHGAEIVDLLRRCWAFGAAKSHWSRVKGLMARWEQRAAEGQR